MTGDLFGSIANGVNGLLGPVAGWLEGLVWNTPQAGAPAGPPAAGHGAVCDGTAGPHPVAGFPACLGRSRRQVQRSGRRGRSGALPGADDGPVGDRGDRQHRRRRDRDPHGRPRRAVLDVGDRVLRHGAQVRGVHPGRCVPARASDGSVSGGPMYYIEKGAGREVEVDGDAVCRPRGDLLIRDRQHEPGEHDGGSARVAVRPGAGLERSRLRLPGRPGDHRRHPPDRNGDLDSRAQAWR